MSAAGSQLDGATRATLTARLKSIEGQARGIQHMLDEGRSCQAIIDQLTALRAATHAVTMEAVTAFALHCLDGAGEAPEAVIARVLSVVTKLSR
jgi:DNA-binding FrmR family transcriptional regulator